MTVNAVLPGPTWTEGLDGYVGEMARNNGIDDAEMERLVFTVGRLTSLLQRFATPGRWRLNHEAGTEPGTPQEFTIAVVAETELSRYDAEHDGVPTKCRNRMNAMRAGLSKPR